MLQIVFRMAPILILFLAPAVFVQSQDLPGPDAILQMEKESIQIAEQFFRDTTELRLRYEYADRFIHETDQEKMRALSRECREKLKEIYNTQTSAKEFIEAYEGDDWDVRFGVTGLWRKLHSDSNRTAWLLCKTDYWFAISGNAPDRHAILDQIIQTCRQNTDVFDPHHALLLTAQAQIQLSVQNPGLLRLAELTLMELLTRYAENKNLPDEVYFRAVMLRLKLEGKATSDQIARLAAGLAKTKWYDDPELNIMLVFLELRFGDSSDRQLVEVLDRIPHVRPLIAGVLLDGLTRHFQEDTLTTSVLQEMTPLQLGLALRQACREEPEKYTGLLRSLAQLQSPPRPLLHFALAQANRTGNPQQAITHYIRAAATQKQQPDPQLNVPAAAIAAAAARQAYQLYFADDRQAQLACQALAFYYDLAEDRPDPKLEYAYATVLRACDKLELADTLLLQIADKAGPYAWQARLDRIAHRLEYPGLTESEKESIKQTIHTLINRIPNNKEQDKQVRNQAIILWCQLVLEKPALQEVQMVLQLLDTVTELDTVIVTVLRSSALRTLKRYPEAAKELATILNSPHQDVLTEALAILTDSISSIDIWQTTKDYSTFIHQLRTLAFYAIPQLQVEQRSPLQLILAELLTLIPDDKEALDNAVSLLASLNPGPENQDINWIRTTARLHMANKRFVRAASIWGNICQATRSLREKDPWPWWQAKYYQLYCFSSIPSTRQSETNHAIDVLLSSTTGCPNFWKERLNALKKP
ncbi:MAG: hypothetical protein JXA82_15985 [Sedimentisphaerales bacterium]|nr:hypothetical protein [Sedimentisphaerales bacterium]